MINEEKKIVLEENQYKRIPKTDKFGIYLGSDDLGRTSMFVKLSKKPVLDNSGKYLIYEYNKREDGLWALTVSIAEQRYIGVFNKLVFDLVDTILESNTSTVAERLFIKRFIEWKTLFEDLVTSTLDFNKIVGLAGELHFLSEFMFKHYGVNNSLNSWCGPYGADKDFSINNTWFEVKTKSMNKDTIHLNSKSQLVSEDIGYLTVIPYEKTSLVNSKSTNLFKLYKKITASIHSQQIQADFDKKLVDLGFIPDEKYEKINFEFHRFVFYEINEEFPQIFSTEFDKAIINVTYDLFLPEVKQFRVEL